MSYIETRCPEVKHETVSFRRRANIDGTGTYEFFTFDREVIWIRETRSTIVYIHGGEVLHQGSQFTDHYGFANSFDGRRDAVESAKQAMEDFEVTAESTLEVAVMTTVTDTPYIPSKEKAFWGGHRRYDVIPHDWQVKSDDPETSYEGYARLAAVIVLEAKTFSSKLDEAANQAVAAEIRKQITPPGFDSNAN